MRESSVPLEYIELKKGGVYHTGYSLGEMVYLKHDNEQHERMITGIVIRPLGVIYELSFGSVSSNHYDIEFSSEKDIVKSTSN